MTPVRTQPANRSYSALVGGAATYAGPDQGIDFTGAGPVYAPDDLKITSVRAHTGWAGEGGLIVGQLLTGPRKGRYVYFAEDIRPARGVRVGQTIRKGQPVAQATGSGKAPGIEIGWARNPAGAAYGTTHDGKPGGPTPASGLDFGKYITGSAGAHPAATTASSGLTSAQQKIYDQLLGVGWTKQQAKDFATKGAQGVTGEGGDLFTTVNAAVASALNTIFSGVLALAGRGLLYAALILGGFALAAYGVKRALSARPGAA